jgi:hypothetical protein
MHDVTLDFDAFLTRTLGGYAEHGVAPIDAVAIATTAAAGVARRRPAPRLVGLSRQWRIAVVVGLTVVALAAVAVIGSQLVRLIQPRAAHEVVITAGSSRACPTPDGGTSTFDVALAVDLDAATSRPLPPECASQILLSPDGQHIADVVGQQLRITDLRAGTSRVLLEPTSADVEAIQFSPRGTYLYWVRDNSAGRPTTLFVTSVAGGEQTPLPAGSAGGYGRATWSLDEERLFVNADGLLRGDGDGTSLRPLTGLPDDLLAISPDGSLLAFATHRRDASDAVIPSDLLISDGSSPPALTRFADAGSIEAAAWLPDGSALAAIVARPSPEAISVGDLELLDARGVDVVRRFQLPGVGDPFDQPYYFLSTSPDGRHVAVFRRVVKGGQQGETTDEAFVIVRLSDGAILPTTSQRPPELAVGEGWTTARLSQLFFSPDGRRIVYKVFSGFQVVNLDGTGSRHLAYSEVAPVGWAGQLVWSPSR